MAAVVLALMGVMLAIAGLVLAADARQKIKALGDELVRLSRRLDRLEHPRPEHPRPTTTERGDAARLAPPPTSAAADGPKAPGFAWISDETAGAPASPEEMPLPWPEAEEQTPAEQSSGPPVPSAIPPSPPAAAPPGAPPIHRPPTSAAGSNPMPPLPPVSPAAAPRPSLEERLGTSVFVWVGGIALALGGAFFVKYSFDAGVLSPIVRMVLGALFGLGLIAGAEFALRRVRGIGAAMAGAGVATLYGVLLAAVKLHALIGPTFGFALMAVVTAAAVALSLRHGQWVALIGLLGGFIMPALIGGESEAVAPMLGYLLLLEVGLLVVTRQRGWIGLSGLTLAGTLAWGLLYAVLGPADSHGVLIGAFLIATAAVYVLSAASPRRFGEADGPPRTGQLLAMGLTAVAAAVVLLGLLAVRGGVETSDLVMLGLVSAGLVVLARIDRRYLGLVPVTAGVCCIVLLAMDLSLRRESDPLDHTRWSVALIVYATIFAGGGYACLWGVRGWIRTTWACISVGSGLALFLVALAVLWAGPRLEDAWGWIAALIGLVYVGAGWPVWRRDGAGSIDADDDADAELLGSRRQWPAAALWLGAAAFFSLAVPLGLDHPWLATGWALLALAGAEAMRLTRLPALRWAVGWLTLATVVVLIVPGPTTMTIGERPVWNVLTPSYGLPMLAFALAAWRLSVADDAETARSLRMVAVFVGLALVTLLIRHGLHPQQMGVPEVTFFEWGAYAVSWLALSFVVGGLGRWLRDAALGPAAGLIATGGAAAALVGAGLWDNPLWSGEPVGAWPVVNGLLWTFGLPAALLGVWAVWLRRGEKKQEAAAAGVAALALVFVLVSLQVRQAYVGGVLDLDAAEVSNAEWYTYSAAWVVLALGMLAAGVWRRSAALRYGSLVVMLLAVGKVFLLDTAQLRDLWRVVSFIGLGLSLLGIGWIYQRYVFVYRPSSVTAAGESSEGKG